MSVGSAVLWFSVGAVTATAVVTRLVPADPQRCCDRVAYGAANVIAGYTGPLAPLTKFVLNATGLTKLLPGLLDKFGVPVDEEP